MMTLEVFSKNFSLTKTLELPDGPVPRVGDVIGAYQDVGYLQGNQTLMVHEVEYALRDNRLQPVIRAHACGDPSDNRRLLLEEQGWLQPRD
jgi:hypothetical protein